jgi:hypothetical protein
MREFHEGTGQAVPVNYAGLSDAAYFGLARCGLQGNSGELALYVHARIGQSMNRERAAGGRLARFSAFLPPPASAYLPGPLASKAAKIIRFTVGERLGQASISRAKSGSICVSRAKEWAKGKEGLSTTY